MFDWGNLEETIEKQKFVDSLKEELEYLKNPSKKRKKKKKTLIAKDKLNVSIFRPKLSKNTIVKEQLMTEKSVRLCNDLSADISNIKLDKLYKGMFNRSNNCFMNVILQSLL
jgi:ubiquitin C-terminal hydrolase